MARSLLIVEYVLNTNPHIPKHTIDVPRHLLQSKDTNKHYNLFKIVNKNNLMI